TETRLRRAEAREGEGGFLRAPYHRRRPANFWRPAGRRHIALSHFCYRRRKTLAPQGPRKLPKLDVAGSTPVARSRENAEFSRRSVVGRVGASHSQPRGWRSSGRARVAVAEMLGSTSAASSIICCRNFYRARPSFRSRANHPPSKEGAGKPSEGARR